MIDRNVLAGKKILVVDDEPDSLMVAKILLEMFGADVITAINGLEGLKRARADKPVFIISDISMPEMSGWELIEALKADRETSEIPVIALTAHAMQGDRIQAIAAGFHNYLSKPLNPETFVTDLLQVVVDLPAFADITG